MLGFIKKLIYGNDISKTEDTVQFRRSMASMLNGRHVRYVLERKENDERVIGREGYLSDNEGEFTVYADGKVLFRCKTDDLHAWEFLSLEGATLTGFDLDQKKERTVLAYYKYYRK